MFSLFLIALRFNISEESLPELLAASVPVFGFLQVPHCPHCRDAYLNWTVVSDLSLSLPLSDDSILLAEADCEEEADVCASLVRVKGYPTFFMIYNGISSAIYIPRTVESLTRTVEHLKMADRTLLALLGFISPVLILYSEFPSAKRTEPPASD
jgi:hypothetical protein